MIRTQITIQLMRSIRAHRYPSAANIPKSMPTHDSQKAGHTSTNLELPKEPSPVTGHSAKAPQIATYANVHLAISFASIKSAVPHPVHTELPNHLVPFPNTPPCAALTQTRPPENLSVSASLRRRPSPQVRNRTNRAGHQLALKRVTLS
jgi:hypothetical protein